MLWTYNFYCKHQFPSIIFEYLDSQMYLFFVAVKTMYLCVMSAQL